jgi:pyruvate dehydrogenase (quinone)
MSIACALRRHRTGGKPAWWACGGHGFTAREPGQLKAAIRDALAADGPAIVDAVVVADEMPNMPHIELEQVGHYAIAKIKEAVLAVTGG